MRLAQSHVSLAERTALQTRKIVILTRWVIALAIAVALVGCLQVVLFLAG
jgi:hypothetical protein